MIDLAWPPGTRIAGRPSGGGYQTGTLLGTDILAGYSVAYVRWDTVRPGSQTAETWDWLDTVLLATIARREVAA